LKHTFQIKKALGIHGIISNEYTWSKQGTNQQDGAQIDLIIDRTDNCINLLEIKFYNDEFEMTSSYAQQLRRRIELFRQHTNTKKNVFLTMLTVFGVKQNLHYLSVATNQLLAETLLVE